ncbi:MAG TPA: hypothetical protein VJ729_17395 [Nitrososphaeraceae archaeon]|nr:hypothetical protein [Nitrososphaeraceae archaeon]
MLKNKPSTTLSIPTRFTVWADYMVGVNWMQKNNDVDWKNEWMATDNGKTWVLK